MDGFKVAIENFYSAYVLSLFEADGATKFSAMDSIDPRSAKKMPLMAVVEPVEEKACNSKTRSLFQSRFLEWYYF
jgi:hypothetical protein